MNNYFFILILIQILYINCLSCNSISNCLSCQGTDSKEYCESCYDNYKLINGECVKDTSCKDSNCEICENRVRCTSCKNGKELKNGKCIDATSNKKKDSNSGQIIAWIFLSFGLITFLIIIIACCYCCCKKSE